MTTSIGENAVPASAPVGQPVLNYRWRRKITAGAGSGPTRPEAERP
jgi:hypothetical protein